VNQNTADPLVNDLYYYAQYHDVWGAHVDANTHYNEFGWKEGRNPDPLSTPRAIWRPTRMSRRPD